MKRPLRILWNAATALSLVLCVGTVALWVRSYRYIDRFTLASARLHRAVSGGGGVFLESLVLVNEKGSWRDRSVTPTRTTGHYAAWLAALPPGTPPPAARATRPYDRATLLKEASGPDLHRAVPQVADVARVVRQTFDNVDGSLLAHTLVGRRVWIPYWLVVAMTGPLPACRTVAHHRRARRARLSLCPACGYDLRGNESGTCPECGTAVKA
jgi:hypothetical protein